MRTEKHLISAEREPGRSLQLLMAHTLAAHQLGANVGTPLSQGHPASLSPTFGGPELRGLFRNGAKPSTGSGRWRPRLCAYICHHQRSDYRDEKYDCCGFY